MGNIFEEGLVLRTQELRLYSMGMSIWYLSLKWFLSRSSLRLLLTYNGTDGPLANITHSGLTISEFEHVERGAKLGARQQCGRGADRFGQTKQAKL